MKTVAIVGAGLSGLALAVRLKDRKDLQVVVYEKSKSVGGRIATRRTSVGKFDHGAQFYGLKPEIKSFHEIWNREGLVQEWLMENQNSANRSPRFFSPLGLTALAKNLAENLDTRFDHRVKTLTLERTAGQQRWRIDLEDSTAAPHFADVVVLTCPLPQSLELLNSSGIDFDPELKEISYAKALVGLLEQVKTTSQSMFFTSPGYIENPTDQIFSISDQNKKGLTQSPAWTVVMNPSFSASHFENSDEKSMHEILSSLKTFAPDFRCANAQLKKWRYSHPLKTYRELYASPADSLFLAGDAFGGPSLNGAVASATACASALLKSV